MKNYLIYPTKVMNITQNYSNSYSHAPHSQGSPADYPIDDACADSGRDWFYCPCDEIKVAHIYGVGKSGTNTIWLTSTSKVVMPCGEDYVTILVTHPNDDTLSGIKEGQTFKRGAQMFKEGNDGNATGYHFHIAVGTGKFTGSGWVKNSKSAWVNQTTGKQLKPEEAFWIDDSFTTVKNACGITFKHLVSASNTEPSTVPLTAGTTTASYSAKGIDVSKWQGNIDWAKVKNAGIKFAMIRLGYGSPDGNANGVDTYFDKNVTNATKAGVDIGCYFYSYAKSVAAAKKEADYVIGVLSKYKGKFTYPIAFDLEDSTQQTLGKTVLTDMVIAFCDTLEKAGYYCSIYSNLNWFKNYLDDARITRFDHWLAQWSSAPTYTGSIGMWQYSSTGSVNGISGNVDMNIAYKDYANVIKNGGLNGFGKPASAGTTAKEPELKTGDVDGDGKLTAADVRLAQRAAVGLEKLNDAQRKAADIDGDGEITAADVRRILRKSVGLDE